MKIPAFIFFMGLLLGSCVGKGNDSAAEDVYVDPVSQENNEETGGVTSFKADKSIADTILNIYVLKFPTSEILNKWVFHY